MTIWLDALRGVIVQQDGTQLDSTGRVLGLDFKNQLLEYDRVTGVVSVGPELSSTRAEVEAATTTALAANTRSGNTLTANANGALGSIDGVALTTNNRVLVKNEATAANNGWYYVADPGGASTPWQLTRTTDADASAEFVSGATTRVLSGTVNARRRYVLTVAGGFVLNTDAVTFTLLSENGIYDVREYGGVEGGSADATDFIQDIADAAAPGGVGLIPVGVWRVDLGSTITIPAAVTLTGMQQRGNRIGHREFSSQTQTGTLLKVYGTANDLFTFAAGGNQTVENLEIWYPDQETNATPDAYGWTFNVGANAHFATIRNCSVLNPYQMLFVDDANGITVDNIVACPLNAGIRLGRVADVARISNVHFIPTAIAIDIGATLTAYILANATAFEVDGAEQFDFTNCFAYGYRNGLQFQDRDTDSFRGCYGSWKGGGFDICERCVNVTEPNGLTLRGLKMSDVSFVPNTTTGIGIRCVDTHTPANDDEQPTIILANFSVHNTFDRFAFLNTGAYANLLAMNGTLRGATNEYFYNAGSGVVSLHNIITPSGGTRTGGGGTLTDAAPITV